MRHPVLAAALLAACVACDLHRAAPVPMGAVLQRERHGDAAPDPGPTVAQQLSVYQALFDRDAPDPAWTDAERERVTSLLRAAMRPGSTLRDAECRRSLCRVRSTHPSMLHYVSFVGHGTRFLSIRNGDALSALEGDSPDGGPLQAVTFIAAEGASLPPVPGSD